MTYRPKLKELIISSKMKLPNFTDDFNEYLALQKSMPILSKDTKNVIDKLQYENTKIQEIIEVIDRDPGLAIEIIKLANSAAFQDKSPVSSIKQAVLRLGTLNVLATTISYGLMSKLPDSIAGQLRSHSFWCGVFSKCLATGTNMDSDMLYTSGLLHDIGIVIMLQFLSKIHYPLFENVGCINETDVFGINHAEAGAIFLESINIPKNVCDIVRNHHNNLSTKREIIVVSLAESLSSKKNGSCPDDVSSLIDIKEASEIVSSPSIKKILQIAEAS